MQFLIDENLPQQLCSMAEDAGHQAEWVREVMPGAEDRAIMERLGQTRETLVTRDVRFANLFFVAMMQDSGLTGVVLIREQRMSAVRGAWKRYLQHVPVRTRALVVLSEHRTRTRRIM